MEQCKKCITRELDKSKCPLCTGENEYNLRKYALNCCSGFTPKVEPLEGVSLESMSAQQKEREEWYSRCFENRKLYDSIHNFINSLTDEQAEKLLVVFNYCDNINDKIYEMLKERIGD